MIKHSQYFTEFKYAKSMISLMASLKVERILDLGIGNASLSLAALQLWPNAHVDSIDIDEKICRNVPLLHSNIHVIHGDVITASINTLFLPNSYDLAVCNPPYGIVPKEMNFQKLFLYANLQECTELKRLSADVIFIAKNILCLKDSGVLCAILPDGLLTRKDLLPFRKALLLHHEVWGIYQLPEKSFSKTEARTHIVLLKKNGKTSEDVTVGIINNEGQVDETILVKSEELFDRMDFSYLKWKSVRGYKQQQMTVQNERITIKRGSCTYKFLNSKKKSFLHSNSFKDGDILDFMASYVDQTDNKVYAEKGDVVMCRVGKRSVGKVAYIKSGRVLISDCLYKISLPSVDGRKLFERLSDEKTKDWIRHSSHGVCAKVISKADLLGYLSKYVDFD